MIMLMLFVSVVITYLDRSKISITAPAMSKELGYSNVQMGWILSGFGWTYAFLPDSRRLAGGPYPAALFLSAILVLWSLATALLGVVGSFVALSPCAC
jgi:ACS family D-galactonate transporter-like MFS transporter